MQSIIEMLFDQRFSMCELLSTKVVSEDAIKIIVECNYRDLLGDYKNDMITVDKRILGY